MEIGDSLFSQTLSIRKKKMEGKHLEKWEREWYRQNKDLVDLKKRYTSEEKAEMDRLNKILG